MREEERPTSRAADGGELGALGSCLLTSGAGGLASCGIGHVVP